METGRSDRKAKLALLIAEFFYSGRFPYAPGTAGSLASLVIWIPSLYCAWPLFVKIALLLILFFIGVWASGYGIRHYHKSDPKQVVIDEVVGQGLPFLVIAPNLFEVITAFAAFRLFDIFKPWPIKWLEKKFENAWGIMIDDVAAGLYAIIAILLAKKILLSY